MKRSRSGPGRRSSDRRTPERNSRSTRECTPFSGYSDEENDDRGPAQSPDSFAREARERKEQEAERARELERRRRAERETEWRRRKEDKERREAKTRKKDRDEMLREEKYKLSAEMVERRKAADAYDQSSEGSLYDENANEKEKSLKVVEGSSGEESRDNAKKDQEEKRVKIASVVRVVNLPEDPQRQAWFGPQTLAEFNRVYGQPRNGHNGNGKNQVLRRPREEERKESVGAVTCGPMEVDNDSRKDQESIEARASREAKEDLENYVEDAAVGRKGWRPLRKSQDGGKRDTSCKTPVSWKPRTSRFLPIEKEAAISREWDDDYEGPGRAERKSRGNAKRPGELSENRGRSRSRRRTKPYNPNRQLTKDDYFGVGPSPPRSPTPPGRPTLQDGNDQDIVARAREEKDRRERERAISSSRYPVKRSGTRYQNIKLIPTDPKIDPPPGKCFNCWQKGHRVNACPRPVHVVWCTNCGRRHVTLMTCPRCSEAAQEALGKKEIEQQKKEVKERGRPEERERDRGSENHAGRSERGNGKRQDETRSSEQRTAEEKNRKALEERRKKQKTEDDHGERRHTDRSEVRPVDRRLHELTIDNREEYLSQREVRDAVNSTLELLAELRDVSPETKSAILKKIFKDK